jgi:hypothetical protein
MMHANVMMQRKRGTIPIYILVVPFRAWYIGVRSFVTEKREMPASAKLCRSALPDSPPTGAGELYRGTSETSYSYCISYYNLISY